MGAFGPNTGSNAVSDTATGTVVMTSPLSMLLGGYAVAVLLLGQASQYLMVTGFNFNIPQDATINGVAVSVSRFGSILSGVSDNSVRIVKAGSVVGTDKALGGFWPAADTVANYGDLNDDWGVSWTPQDINDPNFGVAISAVASLIATAKIGEVTITVSYTGSNKYTNLLKYLRVTDGLQTSEGAN